MKFILFSILFLVAPLNASDKKNSHNIIKEYRGKQYKRDMSKSQNNTPGISQKAKNKTCSYKNNHGSNCNRKS